MTDYKQTRDAAGKVTSQYDKMLRNLDDDDLVQRITELEAQLAKVTAERDRAAALRDHFYAFWNEEIKENTKLNAAIPVAYQMALEAGANNAKKWAARAEENVLVPAQQPANIAYYTTQATYAHHIAEYTRALTPPADLVEQATAKVKGG